MKAANASLVSVLVIAGMALVIGYLLLLFRLPSDARPAMELRALIRAAEHCERDQGAFEVTTDMRRRPIMVACRIDGQATGPTNGGQLED